MCVNSCDNVLIGHGQALAHLAAFAVVALAQAAHGVRDGAVLEAVGLRPALERVALLAQAVLDLVGGRLHGCAVRCGWLLMGVIVYQPWEFRKAGKFLN